MIMQTSYTVFKKFHNFLSRKDQSLGGVSKVFQKLPGALELFLFVWSSSIGLP